MIYIALYNGFVFVYTAAIKLASLWNRKAAQWIEGRRNQQAYIAGFQKNNQKLIWMHCASLGEFEQGRPVLERLKKEYPAHFFLVTFFSPSGYEVQQHYPMADKVLYLPAPSARHARNFLSTFRPDLVIWVKYEYWYHYLAELRHQNIPVILISAIFRERQPFFKWYGHLHRAMLLGFRHLFVQDPASEELLKEWKMPISTTVSGDTRFDRVLEIARTAATNPALESFAAGAPLLIAGSTWPEDEEELDHYCNTKPGLKAVIAPHHIDESRLADIEKLFHATIRYSRLQGLPAEEAAKFKVLIIDNIGMLSSLYQYAKIAYIGGGFGDDGVHNVLEAAVYGKPVIHGPEYDKYREAIELVEAGGSLVIETALELEQTCNQLLSETGYYEEAASAAASYVAANSGATPLIVEYIKKEGLI